MFAVRIIPDNEIPGVASFLIKELSVQVRYLCRLLVEGSRVDDAEADIILCAFFGYGFERL